MAACDPFLGKSRRNLLDLISLESPLMHASTGLLSGIPGAFEQTAYGWYIIEDATGCQVLLESFPFLPCPSQLFAGTGTVHDFDGVPRPSASQFFCFTRG